MVIAEAIQYRAILFLPSTVIIIFTITILTETDNFTSHSYRTFKTLQHCGVKFLGSMDNKERRLTWGITKSGTAFARLLNHINITTDTFTLYSTISSKFTKSKFWSGILELTRFDSVHACGIDEEMTDFLHDGVLWCIYMKVTYKI